MAFITHQLGAFGTQRRDAGKNVLIVGLVVVVAAHGISHVDLFAQLTIWRIFEERVDAGPLQRERPTLAIVTAAFCFFRSQLDQIGWQPTQIGQIIHQQFEIVGLVQKVFTKLLRQGGEFGVYFLKDFFRFFIQVCTRANKSFVRFGQ